MPDLCRHCGKTESSKRAQQAASRFHLRIGRVGHADDLLRDDYTLPLWPLLLILEADGTLASDARAKILDRARHKGKD